MPSYDYKCPHCEHLETKVHTIAQCEFPQECSACGKDTARQVSETNFHLKGSGWYKNSYTSTGKNIYR